jgi:FkbM family methyltransferase
MRQRRLFAARLLSAFWDNTASVARSGASYPSSMVDSQFVTYAQNGEDVLLWRALKHVQRGFYIDVGAQDPVVDSVTKAFYDRGWRGINIEPVQHWYGRLVEQRSRDINLCVAASDHEGELKLSESDDSGLSTANEGFARAAREHGWKLREKMVPCTTLSKICAQHVAGPVHFLKVDCEGAEAAALRGMPLSHVRPWIILVEASEPNTSVPTYAQWEPLLSGGGYEFVYADGINRYYVAGEKPELRAAFVFPPNALDNYIHASEFRARELQLEVAGLQSELRGRGAEISRLQQEHVDVTREREAARAVLVRMQGESARQAEIARAQATEILRLQREYRDVTEERESVRMELAGVRHDRRALEDQLAAISTRLSHLKHEHSLIMDAHKAARAEIAAMQASRSWRLTAPLRGLRRVCGKAKRAAKRHAVVCLRPVARSLRPALRRLSRNNTARRLVVGALGREAMVVRHGRLFLFGPPAQSAPRTMDSRVEIDTDERRGNDSFIWSYRQRTVLKALRDARARKQRE